MVGIIIATISTTVANNIHKSGIPPERSLLTGERGQGRATTDSTEGKKWSLVTDAKSRFIAGKLRDFFTAWHQITNDSIILESIKYLKIDFQEKPRMTIRKKSIINSEIQKLLKIGVIVGCDR